MRIVHRPMTVSVAAAAAAEAAAAAAASPEATPLPMLADVSQHVSQC